VQLDPQNSFMLQQSSFTYELLRRYGDVASILDRALAITPNDFGNATLTQPLEHSRCCLPMAVTAMRHFHAHGAKVESLT
jgi:hypothetical protein